MSAVPFFFSSFLSFLSSPPPLAIYTETYAIPNDAYLRKGAAHVADIKAGGAFGAGVVTKKHRADGGALNDYTCGGGAMMEQYLKHPEVVKALHVKAGTAGMRYVRMRIFFGCVACLLIAFYFFSFSFFLFIT